MKNRMNPRWRVNGIKIKGVRVTHLYEDKLVRLGGFEELTEYVVDERYEILVRLVFGKRLLIHEDGSKQV